MSKSKAVGLAEAFANAINTTPYLWPNPDPDGADNPVPHLITDYVTAKAFVIPTFKRTALNELTLACSPPADNRDIQQGFKDRCGRMWQYSIDIALVQLVDENDPDITQPMTLKAIDALMAFAEAIADFIDLPANRYFIEGYSLIDMAVNSYDEAKLIQEHMFHSTTLPVYSSRAT